MDYLFASHKRIPSHHFFVKYNFNAKCVIELLDPSSLWFPPPILTKFTLAIHVRLVYKASMCVVGQENRNGMIKNIVSSQSIKSFETKSQYNFELYLFLFLNCNFFCNFAKNSTKRFI